jgi:hypothetical protein
MRRTMCVMASGSENAVSTRHVSVVTTCDTQPPHALQTPLAQARTEASTRPPPFIASSARRSQRARRTAQRHHSLARNTSNSRDTALRRGAARCAEMFCAHSCPPQLPIAPSSRRASSAGCKRSTPSVHPCGWSMRCTRLTCGNLERKPTSESLPAALTRPAAAYAMTGVITATGSRCAYSGGEGVELTAMLRCRALWYAVALGRTGPRGTAKLQVRNTSGTGRAQWAHQVTNEQVAGTLQWAHRIAEPMQRYATRRKPRMPRARQASTCS